jgi:Ser-tRNA(Ala) deacylase AlaX
MLMIAVVTVMVIGCSKDESFSCTCTHTYSTGGGHPPTNGIINAKDRSEASQQCAKGSRVDPGGITHSCNLD